MLSHVLVCKLTLHNNKIRLNVLMLLTGIIDKEIDFSHCLFNGVKKLDQKQFTGF